MKTKLEYWALNRIQCLANEAKTLLFAHSGDMGVPADGSSHAHRLLEILEETDGLAKALNEQQ